MKNNYLNVGKLALAIMDEEEKRLFSSLNTEADPQRINAIKGKAQSDIDRFFDDLISNGWDDPETIEWRDRSKSRIQVKWTDAELLIIERAQQVLYYIIDGDDHSLLQHFSTRCGADGFARRLIDYLQKNHSRPFKDSPIYTYLELISNAMIGHHLSTISRAGEDLSIVNDNPQELALLFDELYAGVAKAIAKNIKDPPNSSDLDSAGEYTDAKWKEDKKEQVRIAQSRCVAHPKKPRRAIAQEIIDDQIWIGKGYGRDVTSATENGIIRDKAIDALLKAVNRRLKKK